MAVIIVFKEDGTKEGLLVCHVQTNRPAREDAFDVPVLQERRTSRVGF